MIAVKKPRINFVKLTFGNNILKEAFWLAYIEDKTIEEELHSGHVTTAHVQLEQAVETLQKPIGSYITIEMGKPLSRHPIPFGLHV